MDDFPETRLQEAEIKLAFLEKELADYREAVDELHAELSRLARRVKALEAGEEAAGQAGPEPTSGEAASEDSAS